MVLGSSAYTVDSEISIVSTFTHSPSAGALLAISAAPPARSVTANADVTRTVMRELTAEKCNVIKPFPLSKEAVFTQPNPEAKGVRLITRKQQVGQSARGSMCNGDVPGRACYQHL